MRMRNLDEQIRDYYENRKLSDETRARLKARLRAGTRERRGARRSWLRAGIAAGLAAVVAAALWMLPARRSSPESPERIAAAIARQAAVGHNERRELEFRASRTAELRQTMKSLDFTPVEPGMMAGTNMRVVGARYTTIEGVIAAQILYVDAKGEPCTLYQVRPVERLARVPATEADVDGLRVSVWREKGLLMVLARPLA